ncbi:PAS domain-containing hybrid sensor histidine kinase/response regulator [Aporhodopirellula aestuarii]|uniref:histidine kinase n=1 Tax=Aporhodopirellula aestuarii TaxID=2950107 RepID=A0ABT0TZ61_9BACT|nr:PAS domain-containing hybrid sensor histidine kinase/response regulator [Aporhodopirellula aestuarii]MCM2369669.1 ATP-binding protein [Aporhodopirellula aestuarii]
MHDFIIKFFDTSDFPPRWYCGNWSDFLGWLHILSDFAIGAAYFGIPLSLIYFARKRKDIILPRIIYLFATFIVACGCTHMIDAVIFWHPIYRVGGLAKFLTAAVSWVTLGVIIKNLPAAMNLPSLTATIARLETEVEQRITTERQLLAANARHKALIEGTRSIVWTANPEGRFITPQASWERYTGQTWNELRDFGWVNVIHEEDRDELLRKWNQASTTLTKYQSTGRIWSHVDKAFRQFVAEAVPVFDTDGSVLEWVGTISDIEEQHQAEVNLGIARTELVKQKRELELIYQSAPVGMSLIDREYRFLRINDTLARINGVPREDHIGRRADEFLNGFQDQIKPYYDQVFRTAKPVTNVEIVDGTPNSPSQRTWLASYYPLATEGDQGTAVTAVSAIVQDITSRKEQETRLRESEQLALAASQSKSEFLANMSHEIRTPMAAILGYADVLLGHLQDPDNRNCVLIMKRNGEHLLELINDILDLSRIEAGKLDVNVESTPLPQLVADIQSLMAVRAEEKKVKFDVVFEGLVPETIETDPTRLRQVLINLIGNAIKFTDEGEVRLKVKFLEGVKPPVIEFAIEDTGIGMTREQQERLFKPFSQGDSSVTRQYGGSGLGLAISQRLVQMMDGEMDLKSEPAKGSTFFVRLPLASFDDIQLVKPSLVVRQGEPDAPPMTTPKLSCRVLIVDDRRDVRHISQHFLEKAGAIVATAEDGQQGIDATLAARESGQPFDLIVMDMQMPNVDGLDATAQLRSAGIQSPIIALTADAMKGDRDRCLNGGCDDYLSKPIDHMQLVGMVANYTQQIPLEDLIELRKQRIRTLRETIEDETRES